MTHIFYYKFIFNKTMDCYQGFLFQFCDIENLVSLSKNLTKSNLFAKEKQKNPKFSQLFSQNNNKVCHKKCSLEEI